MTVPGPEIIPQHKTIGGERRGLNIAVYELKKFHSDFYNGREKIFSPEKIYDDLSVLSNLVKDSPAGNMLITTIDNFSQNLGEEDKWYRTGLVHTIASGLLEGTGDPKRAVEILVSPVTVESRDRTPQSYSLTEWAMTCDKSDLASEKCDYVLAQAGHRYATSA